MAYKLFKSPQVDIDLENAYDYYFSLDYTEVLVSFDKAIEDCYQSLEINPFYRVRYKILELYLLRDSHISSFLLLMNLI